MTERHTRRSTALWRKERGWGITLKTALFSWLVTIGTLLSFVAVMIPQQKRTFLQHLESKGRGVAASLQDGAASSVVNADYSQLVQQSLTILAGDKSVDYLVLTKNDGFSLISDRAGWRQVDRLPAEWHPAEGNARGTLAVVPLFQRRVFQYSQPFEYRGVRWGWIHVGLSLRDYEQSLAAAYQRTIWVAAICMALSLGVSVVYAKWLVQPILSLRAVVQRVAGGDLSARSTIVTRDELGSLGRSVNAMTEALLRRGQILRSVRVAAQQLLSAAEWERAIGDVLGQIGEAAEVGRLRVFENDLEAAGGPRTRCCFEWAGSGLGGLPSTVATWGRAEEVLGFSVGLGALQRGEMVLLRAPDLDPSQRALLERDRIRSLIAVPINVNRRWWGTLVISEAGVEREWDGTERDSFRAAADLLGAAVARQQAQDALVQANATLENRVEARTHELREQVAAKERALAELAQTQHRLMEVSRRSGMAEVATEVLHNVGNVLNSVNVSTTLLADGLRGSRVMNLAKVTALLEAGQRDWAAFFTTDPKGRLVPEYLRQLATQLVRERDQMLGEVAALAKNVEHIKGIVTLQQNAAKVAGVLETLQVAELLEDSLRVHAVDFERHGVRVTRDYQEVLPVTVERHKVLQIFINLIQNAKHALREGPHAEKRLDLAIRGNGDGVVRISVRDNGVGIPAENLTRVFSHGFTTRANGHGFGLHSGALAAREMGGRLRAESGGPGAGATFTLELPATKSPS